MTLAHFVPSWWTPDLRALRTFVVSPVWGTLRPHFQGVQMVKRSVDRRDFLKGAAVTREARPRALISRLTDAERQAHEAFVQSLGPSPLWREYTGGNSSEGS